MAQIGAKHFIRSHQKWFETHFIRFYGERIQLKVIFLLLSLVIWCIHFATENQPAHSLTHAYAVSAICQEITVSRQRRNESKLKHRLNELFVVRCCCFVGTNYETLQTNGHTQFGKMVHIYCDWWWLMNQAEKKLQQTKCVAVNHRRRWAISHLKPVVLVFGTPGIANLSE